MTFSLQKGDTIGVFAPSSYVEKEDIETAKAVVESLGYKVFVHSQTFERYGQLAGTTSQKIDALHDLYSQPDIKAIWVAGGGNRSLDMLDSIDLDMIIKNPKPIVGFSDATALLNHLAAYSKTSHIHGPVFKNIKNDAFAQYSLDVLSGKTVSYALDGSEVLKDGSAQGRIIGGNLSVMFALSPSLPASYFENSILLLEDCAEELNHIDRMFIALKHNKTLSQISGLILGEFTHIKDTGRPFGFDLKNIVLEHCVDLDIPIMVNAPFGHGENMLPFPIGVSAQIDTHSKTLHLSMP